MVLCGALQSSYTRTIYYASVLGDCKATNGHQTPVTSWALRSSLEKCVFITQSVILCQR